MSFLNDATSCQGAANPLNKFIETSNGNQDLNNFQNINNQNNLSRQNIHNYNNIDRSLQNDFNNFAETTPASLNSNIIPNSISVNNTHHIQYSNHVANNTQQTEWIQDFNDLSLQDGRQYQQMGLNPSLQQQQQQQQQAHQQRMHYQLPNQIQNQRLNLNTSRSYTSRLTSNSQQQTQQQDIPQQDFDEINNKFDDMFNEVENDINKDQNTQSNEEEDASINTPNDEEDKIKFAMLAQNVFNVMNNTPKHVSSNTSDKFKQSGFMQLMRRISSREIEISKDKKKFVDQNGIDINSNVNQTLPNPLNSVHSDITDSAFDSAVKIGQKESIKVESSAWQGDFA